MRLLLFLSMESLRSVHGRQVSELCACSRLSPIPLCICSEVHPYVPGMHWRPHPLHTDTSVGLISIAKGPTPHGSLAVPTSTWVQHGLDSYFVDLS